jgi:hypothetical protein
MLANVVDLIMGCMSYGCMAHASIIQVFWRLIVVGNILENIMQVHVQRVQGFALLTSRARRTQRLFERTPYPAKIKDCKLGKSDQLVTKRFILSQAVATSAQTLTNITKWMLTLRTTSSSNRRESKQTICSSTSRGLRVCGTYCWGDFGHPWTKLLSASCCVAARPWQI